MDQGEACFNVSENYPNIGEFPAYASPLALALFILSQLYFVTTNLWMYSRRHMHPLRHRRNTLVSISSFSIVVLSISVCWREYILRWNFKCDWYLWSIMSYVPVAIGPVVIRCIYFRNRAIWNNAKDELVLGDQTNSFIESLHKMKKKTTWRYNAGMLILVLAPSIFSTLYNFFASDNYGHNCRGCLLSMQDAIMFAATGVLLIGFMLVTLRKAKAYSDPGKEMHEIKTSLRVFLGFSLIWFLADQDFGKYRWHGQGYWNCGYLLLLGSMASHYYQAVKPTLLTYRRAYARVKATGARRKTVVPQQGLNSSAKISLRTVINSQKGKEAFAQHLKNEYTIENLKFWDAVEEFNQRCKGDSSTNALARSIYTTFISDDAILQVNIAHSPRVELDKIFADDNADIPRNTFDDAQEEIFNLLESDCFVRFKGTELYFEAVGDMVLDMTGDVGDVDV